MKYINFMHSVPVIRMRAVLNATPMNRPARNGRESGTALVMALVILMILTILGISSMNTSIMEERMSGNIQDLNRAFEAAESGLSRALLSTSFNPANPPPPTVDYDFGTGATATKASVTTTFLGISESQVNSGNSMTKFQSANFAQRSVGQTSIGTGAQVELHQGVSQAIQK